MLSKLSSIVNNPSTKVKIVGSSVIVAANSAISGSGSGCGSGSGWGSGSGSG